MICGGSRGEGTMGIPTSGQVTLGKGTELSSPVTELLPFLAASVPAGSARAMPSHPRPPSKVAQMGHNPSPKGLQQSQGLAPTF